MCLSLLKTYMGEDSLFNIKYLALYAIPLSLSLLWIIQLLAIRNFVSKLSMYLRLVWWKYGHNGNYFKNSRETKKYMLLVDIFKGLFLGVKSLILLYTFAQTLCYHICELTHILLVSPTFQITYPQWKCWLISPAFALSHLP